MLKETKKIKITINGGKYEAVEGETVLEICHRNDIPIAALCRHSDFEKSETLCRLCLVKVSFPKEKQGKILPSCALKAISGMEIITEDTDIIRIRKTILELLFLEHAGLCASCYRNLSCELQAMAIKYSIDEFRFVPRVAEMESEEALERLRDRLSRKITDIQNSSIARDSSKCIECRRCVKACKEIQNIRAIDVQRRGIQTGIGTEHYTPLECTYCGQCTLHCPTAAIIEKSEMVAVIKALKDPNKTVVAQIAPSVQVTLGEGFGMIPGTVVTGKMVAALKKCGFEFVFDASLGVDFTVSEVATEFVERLKKEDLKYSLPFFTSFCPAWVLFCEQFYPEMIPYLSSVRSPQMIMGSLIKSYYANESKTNPEKIVVVSVVPCTARKYEAARPEFSHNGVRDVDYVLTVRELAHIIKNFNLPFTDLAPENFNSNLGTATGSGIIFEKSGGAAETILRTTHQYLLGKSFPGLEIKETRENNGFREVKVSMGDKNIRIALVSGLNNARNIIEMVRQSRKPPFEFIEVMACPGGCIGGGGQPQPINEQIKTARTKAIYIMEKDMAVRESHKNPLVQKIYRNFLYGPGSRKSEKLLHTKHHPFKFKLREEHIKNSNNQ